MYGTDALKIIDQLPAVRFVEFLEAKPPGAWFRLAESIERRPDARLSIKWPPLSIYCSSSSCAGVRIYDVMSDGYVQSGSLLLSQQIEVLVRYQCRNCKKTTKHFAIVVFPHELKSPGAAQLLGYKLGELPNFGPPIPARVNSLIGPDRELFFQGYRAEKQGMGIGAAAYYRRVVENQKARIFDEIIRVAQALGGHELVIEDMEHAKRQTQFTTAVEAIKHALPPALQIQGCSPLTLLHSALSDNLHNHSDRDCLAQAQDIRLILFELAERLGSALADSAQLKAAIARLGQQQQNKGQVAKP